MSKESPKSTPLEKAQDWLADHADEAFDRRALEAAVSVAEKANDATIEAATRLGLALEARKAAFQALKAALKVAKAARKATPAPVAPTPTPVVPAPAKKAAAKKATPKKVETKS